jgi:hypothetical protein
MLALVGKAKNINLRYILIKNTRVNLPFHIMQVGAGLVKGLRDS